jgi:4-hydroxythreonine-4-phosphate dehydrogenase
MNPVLDILLGDAAGIGPEIVAKLLAAGKFEEYCRPGVIGDARVLARGMEVAARLAATDAAAKAR